jgi:predicted  nucleic acid-binding Zn-ribbon protein
MKTFISTSLIVAAVFSLNVNASIVKFAASNDTFNTSVCVVAAKNGIEEAKKMLTDNRISFKAFNKDISCNEKTLRSFSKKMERKRLAAQVINLSN